VPHRCVWLWRQLPDTYVYRHVVIIHTRVNVSFLPVLAIAPCSSVPTFPYRFLLLFVFVLLMFLQYWMNGSDALMPQPSTSPAACLPINYSPSPSFPPGSPVLEPQGSTQRTGTTTAAVVEYGGPFDTHYFVCTSSAISAIERVRLGCVTMDQMVILAKQHDRQFFRKGGSVRCLHVLFVGLFCRTPCITSIP